MHFFAGIASLFVSDCDGGDPAYSQQGQGPERCVQGKVDPVELLGHGVPEIQKI